MVRGLQLRTLVKIHVHKIMNISQFEQNKPTQTYHALQSLITKYSMIVENHQTNGQQLLMEGTDAQSVHMAGQFVRELENLKSLFMSGR